MKCRECGSEEHFAAQCPSKGAGKGSTPSPAFPAFTDNGRASAPTTAHGAAPAWMYVAEDSDGDDGTPAAGNDTSYEFSYMVNEDDTPDLEEGPGSPPRPASAANSGDRLYERDPWATVANTAEAAGMATAHAASSLISSTPSATSWVRVSESNQTSRTPTPQAKTPGTAAASARPPTPPRPADNGALIVATPMGEKWSLLSHKVWQQHR